ncbi:putative alpha-ketoglutarate-dependent dioxygenase ABH4 [Papilio machaon]|uniref:Putative alpha-ketoglutarate-dependent dioxygenase ABH4 n=1 Tax=Papilio machaon TaxID=76193 RepID=A0A194QWH9_PAPMA|nr:putative alpha-ketoglutarate-dependent dioxygenase ABH4 [Papilio machaon]
MKPRPCGCKGCRTCLICEKFYGAESLKLSLKLDKNKGYVYCPFCNKAWPGWEIDEYKQHPNHSGEPINYPGIYIEPDFITASEEEELIKCIDQVPWDISQSGRRKQNYGPKTNFKKKKIVPGNFEGFPEFSKFLQDRFKSIDLLRDYQVIEQCSLEYDPSKGASIDPHIDDCWIWGERIVTVNCLSDSVLTMTVFKGDIKKYNLYCADEYYPVVQPDGSIDLEFINKDKTMLDSCKPNEEIDAIIRIPLIRRSIIVMYGESRYHWEHCILREDITSRRVCIAYREFTPPYLTNGAYHEIGNEITTRAKKFWDHKSKYKKDDEIIDT